MPLACAPWPKSGAAHAPMPSTPLVQLPMTNSGFQLFANGGRAMQGHRHMYTSNVLTTITNNLLIGQFSWCVQMWRQCPPPRSPPCNWNRLLQMCTVVTLKWATILCCLNFHLWCALKGLLPFVLLRQTLPLVTPLVYNM